MEWMQEIRIIPPGTAGRNTDTNVLLDHAGGAGVLAGQQDAFLRQ